MTTALTESDEPPAGRRGRGGREAQPGRHPSPYRPRRRRREPRVPVDLRQVHEAAGEGGAAEVATVEDGSGKIEVVASNPAASTCRTEALCGKPRTARLTCKRSLTTAS
ncbi:hypothetical protein GCM10010429_26730 [Micromonospora olivasterospora]